MKKLTIGQIKKHRFVGNHASDNDMFTRIGNFVTDTTNSLADRAEALRQMSDRGMGLGRWDKLSDEKLVKQYMKEYKVGTTPELYAEIDGEENADIYMVVANENGEVVDVVPFVNLELAQQYVEGLAGRAAWRKIAKHVWQCTPNTSVVYDIYQSKVFLKIPVVKR